MSTTRAAAVASSSSWRRASLLRVRGGHSRGGAMRRPPHTRSIGAAAAAAKAHELYPHTFEPLDLGPDVSPLPNRVIMGSMHCGLEGHSIPRALSWFLRPSGGGGKAPRPEFDHADELAEYYAERAGGGAGLIVTGGVSPNRTGALTPFGSKLTTQEEVEYHERVTSRVREVNPETKMILQILHAGRYAMHPFLKSASAVPSPLSPFVPKAMSTSEVHSTVRDYVNCAVLAQRAGYAGIELMGSEGYLIHQFICPRTNERSDEYGGTYPNRIRLALEIVREIREALPKSTGFVILFRLSMLDLVEKGSTWDEIVHLAQELEHAGVTIINTGIGWHEARVPTIATMVPRGAYTWVTRLLKPHVNVPVCTTNRINTPEMVEEVLRRGEADLVSMARPFLADAEFMRKSYECRADEINTCIGCNQACLDHVFVGRRASCLVNPRACHELQLPRIEELSLDSDSSSSNPSSREEDGEGDERGKLRRRLRVAVVGAGPGGLACSLTFAQLGHETYLFDRSPEIGGQFNMAKRIPGKADFYDTLRYFDVMMDRAGVKRRLGRTVSGLSDLMDNEEEDGGGGGGQRQPYDVIVVATGVLPRTPPIPNVDHPKVLSYVDVLRGNVPVGDRVAIIGAGGIGFDVAEFLLHGQGGDGGRIDEKAERRQRDVGDFMMEWGVDKSHWGRDDGPPNHGGNRGGLVPPVDAKPRRNIVIMQRKTSKLGAGLGKTTGWIHRASLQHGHVEMIPGCRYERVDDDVNLHVTVDGGGKDGGTGETRVLEADNVILCAGQEENDGLRKLLENDVSSSPGTVHATAKDGGDVRSGSKVYVIGGAYEAAELDAKRAIDMGTRLAYAVHSHPGDGDEATVRELVYGEREMEEEERMLRLFARMSGKKL